MELVSYAQNSEDILLWRALKHLSSGFYVDVGASDPINDSVTKLFYERGWRGINVEPSQDVYTLLTQYRPNDINLDCAVGDFEGTSKFYNVPTRGWSTSDQSVGEHRRTNDELVHVSEVEIRLLDTILERYVEGEIHFLKIDVEGAEPAVLNGLNLQRFRPWILLVESISPITQKSTHEEWEAKILDARYKFVFFDGLNRFYLAEEHWELHAAFSSPPNVLDEYVTQSVFYWHTQAQILETKLKEAETRTQTLEVNFQDAKVRAHELEIKIQESEIQAHELEIKIQEAETRAQTLEAKLQEAKVRIQELETKVQGSEIQAQELEAKVQESEGRAETLESKFQEVRIRAQELEMKVQKTEIQVQELGIKVQEAAERIQELEASSIRLKIKKVLIYLLTIKNGAIQYMKDQYIKKLIYAVGSRLFTVVRRWPAFKRSLVFLLSRFPKLDSYLRSVLFPQPTQLSSVVSPVELADAVVQPTMDIEQVVLPLGVGQRVLYIFVDHTIICPTNTGMQRVARGLAGALGHAGENIRYVKWDAVSKQCVFINLDERYHLAQWNGPEVQDKDFEIYPRPTEPVNPISMRPIGENHWLIVPEVTHITFQSEAVTLDVISWARRAGLKTGFIFYDAIPLFREEFANMAEAHARYMQQLLLADMVWPISTWAAHELMAYWQKYEYTDIGTIPDIEPCLLSGESQLCKRVVEPTEGEKIILSVGTLEPRKNQCALIRAFEDYIEKHPDTQWQLILVGNLHPAVANEVAQAIQKNSRIRHLGHITDEELDHLYRTCSFSVFPSVQEGFGLPILESLWYGKPCLCADFGSMAEVAEGGGCLSIDVRNQKLLTSSLTRLIEDTELLNTLVKEAITRNIRTWNEYATSICTCIDRKGNTFSQLGSIYYWVDATLQFPKNTGIQRVCRQLARGLMDVGLSLIPVKWDKINNCFSPVSKEQLSFLAQWNGPAISMWDEWIEPNPKQKDAWFLMPDLPLNLSTDEREHVINYVDSYGMHSAAIFYDAIPWKMRGIYPAHFSQAHREYMLQLGRYKLVLPISNYSRHDLVDFLGAELLKPQSLDTKIKAVQLPGEFSESSRVTELSSHSGSTLTLLSVGTVEPRKNHESLIEAFLLVSQKTSMPMKLIIVGRRTEPDLAARIEGFVEKYSNIIWEENADDSQLHQLHLECDFTIYPSLEEGFGLPILESLWYGKPCICANFGSMYEVAEGGGCIATDVRNVEALAEAITQLTHDPSLREHLASEAINRHFKSWSDYAKEIATCLAEATPIIGRSARFGQRMFTQEEIKQCTEYMQIDERPLLSICITTYNRAEWLAVSLKSWSKLYPQPLPEVELVVCDNTSTDNTHEIVKPYLSRPDFSYHRNSVNVGMLGNLRETAHHARGKYIWIIGDDDLLMPRSIERILDTLRRYPEIALVYLNYAYTRIDDARTVVDFDAFFNQATPIVPAEEDRQGPIHDICARNENFFTAIYTLVFRRDHAMRAYSQNTSGRPFSTMLTCIPTTYYVLNHMMDKSGVWIGEPQIVVNLNVSWLKYAPLWILERIPEVYEKAELMGVSSEDIDRWRRHTLPGVEHYFKEIFEHDPLDNAKFFSPSRLVRRFKHLPEFHAIYPKLSEIYVRAHENGNSTATLPVEKVFPKLLGSE